MEPGSPVPPGHGGLREGRHPHAPGHLHPQLQAREQMLARGDGLPPPGDCQHGQSADHGPQRRSRAARRRRR